MEVRDQQGVPPQHWPGVLEKFLTEDRTSGFELGLAPLWRVTLFQWDADASEFVWTFHHALLDGRAHSLLLEELCRLYEALRTGRAPELLPAPAFTDYLSWLAAQPVEASRKYWQAALKNFVDSPALPTLTVATEESDDATPHELQKIVFDAAAKARLLAGASGAARVAGERKRRRRDAASSG